MGSCWSSHCSVVVATSDPVAPATERTQTVVRSQNSSSSNLEAIEPQSRRSTVRAAGAANSFLRPLWNTNNDQLARGTSLVEASRPTFAFNDLEPNTDTVVETYSVEDINNLIQELRIMEMLFQSLFGAGGQGNENRNFFPAMWFYDPNPPPGGPPPASDRAMRQLPNVVVTQNDLLDEANRECCICFCDVNLGDKLTRLPCGHLYHRPCISEWLRKHCTCPVCRFELETDDPVYERGRVERMASRKLRYHKYELDRMTIRELHELMRRINLMDRHHIATEKSELVDFIMKSGKIDVISVAPVPTTIPQYRISDLRTLGISKLKKVMADNGVFFDPADVIEKEDMVQIFVNSGRVDIIPEDNITEEARAASAQERNSSLQRKESRSSGSGGIIQEDEWEMVDATDEALSTPMAVEESENISTDSSVPTEEETTAMETNVQTELQDLPQQDLGTAVGTEGIENATPNTISRSSSYSSTTSRSNLSSYNISQLRQLAYQLNVSLSGCLEKEEMIDRIATAAATRRNER
jgi:hypothetical protein